MFKVAIFHSENLKKCTIYMSHFYWYATFLFYWYVTFLLRALSWASRVKLCREPSRDFSQRMFFSRAYRIERYKTNNELPSGFQYGSFCRRICPNFTLNNFSCKRYVIKFLEILISPLKTGFFFYKGLQRVGYFLKTNICSVCWSTLSKLMCD